MPAIRTLALQAHDWPGNVRELANLIERLIVIRANGTVTGGDLPWVAEHAGPTADDEFRILSSRLRAVGGDSLADLPSEGIDLKGHLANVEQDMIRRALADSDGVVQRAAEMLGVGRTTLVEKIKRYGLHAPGADDG